jgi:hypothetical protein
MGCQQLRTHGAVRGVAAARRRCSWLIVSIIFFTVISPRANARTLFQNLRAASQLYELQLQ